MAFEEVSQPLDAPYRAVCWVRATFADGRTARGSGVVLGANDVLTALHVVFDPDAGYAVRIEIVPATDTVPTFTAPLGRYTDMTSVVGRAPTWDVNGDRLISPSEAQGDFALIGLSSRISDATGALPVLTTPYVGQAQMVGYPSRGTGQMRDTVAVQPSSQFGVYTMNAALGSGGSGGPLLVTGDDGVTRVAGTSSSGNLSNTAGTYAGLFGAGTAQWLQQAMAANNREIVPVSLAGGPNADVLASKAADERVDGGAGVDVWVLSGALNQYLLSTTTPPDPATPRRWTVADTVGADDPINARNGTDVLAQVERLRFSDQGLALDIQGSAGQAVRLVGVLGGTAAVKDPAVAAQALPLWDAGLSTSDVAQLVVSNGTLANLAGGSTTADWVALLLRNALDRAPSTAELADAVQAVQLSGWDTAQWLVWASQQPAVAAAVDLTGLGQTGWAFALG